MCREGSGLRPGRETSFPIDPGKKPEKRRKKTALGTGLGGPVVIDD
jgi:hypothetical protein